MAELAGCDVGSVRRRRERRLRQWLRHERMTVAMVLAESTHHATPRGQKEMARTREEVESETRNVPRGQTTPPLGMRSGVLLYPEPQDAARGDGSSPTGSSDPAMPSLAGAGGEAVDAANHASLTRTS